VSGGFAAVRNSPLRRLILVLACSLAALGLTACGNSKSTSTSTAATVPSAVTSTAAASTATTAVVRRAPAPHLRILAPRHQAHLEQTVAVRVALTGAKASGPRAFRYVLDGRFTRFGPPRLTFHDIVPGRHHLIVALASHPSARATSSFFVTAPAQAATPSTATSMSSTMPPPTTSAPPPATIPEPVPPPTPVPSGGIPQGPNAGDADGDNRGGASDGDGNI
jgi:hypothetical protein